MKFLTLTSIFTLFLFNTEIKSQIRLNDINNPPNLNSQGNPIFTLDQILNPNSQTQTNIVDPIQNLPQKIPSDTQIKPAILDNIIKSKSTIRQFDGTKNNQKNTQFGAKNTLFKRLCPANYQDGIGKMWQSLPNPRTVSNMVGQVSQKFEAIKNGANILFVQYGQLMDHDIALSAFGQNQKQDISIPICDKFFDKQCTGKQSFQFIRSATDPTKKQRTPINGVTHWLDAGQIYGDDKKAADSFRSFTNGKFIEDKNQLPPKDENGNFITADFRANQNPSLIIFQIIFRRQHNRICDLILLRNSKLKDQEIYNSVKNYVTGLYQHIAYDEFLPLLLGPGNYQKLIGPYKYDNTIDPSLTTDFSTAGYRVGHSLVNAPFPLMDNNGGVIRNLQAGEIFFNPNLVNSQTVDQFLNGFLRTNGKQRSLQLIDDLRSFLFAPGRNGKIDLFSFNLQRGRDHGVCKLNDAREKLGLTKKTNFNELFGDQKKADILSIISKN